MATRRHAFVCVVNKTGRKIDWVKVYHRYDDEDPEFEVWIPVRNRSRSRSFEVSYETGLGKMTTDHWRVIWEMDRGRLRFQIDDWKMHMLRAEDEGQLTRIILSADGRIEIVSNSGTSTTTARAIRQTR